MWMLWLALCCAGVAAVSAGKADYPEVERLPAIAELPDPFLMPDGRRVRASGDWERQRKTLLHVILHYQYGPLPPIPHNVRATEIAARRIEASGATEREMRLTMGPKEAIQTRLFLTVPAGEGPFPVIITGDLGWARIKPEIVAEAVRRGYLLAEFSRVDIAPDSAAREGVYAAWPDYDGGRLAVWAWGFHRVVDYLATLPNVDKNRIAVTGHSRGGKAALLAGAADTRIALTAPNNSGCGGAGCYRIQGAQSEDIAAILRNFPYWFHPRFAGFIGQVERLPFDQHTLKALVAPRALLSTEALGDLWANPSGTQQTYRAAKRVYEFLGAGEKIGIVFREGRHEQNANDWNALLDFADRQFFDKPAERPFDRLAFPDLPEPAFGKSPGSPAGG